MRVLKKHCRDITKHSKKYGNVLPMNATETEVLTSTVN